MKAFEQKSLKTHMYWAMVASMRTARPALVLDVLRPQRPSVDVALVDSAARFCRSQFGARETCQGGFESILYRFQIDFHIDSR